MIGSVIGNDDDGTTGIGQQLLHEGNKLPGVHLVLDNAAPTNSVPDILVVS